MFKRVIISQEAIDGIMRRELEYTFYAKLSSHDVLQKALEVEEHEQWNMPLETEAPVRMRLRLINNRRYTMATKVKQSGVKGFMETEIDVSKDFFESCKLAAIEGYKKTRYKFAAENGLQWEVDVFLDNTGKPHPWVKIDLEVNKETDKIPELPFPVQELIINNSPNQTAKEIALVDNLWDKEWFRIDRFR